MAGTVRDAQTVLTETTATLKALGVDLDNSTCSNASEEEDDRATGSDKSSDASEHD